MKSKIILSIILTTLLCIYSCTKQNEEPHVYPGQFTYEIPRADYPDTLLLHTDTIGQEVLYEYRVKVLLKSYQSVNAIEYTNYFNWPVVGEQVVKKLTISIDSLPNAPNEDNYIEIPLGTFLEELDKDFILTIQQDQQTKRKGTAQYSNAKPSFLPDSLLTPIKSAKNISIHPGKLTYEPLPMSSWLDRGVMQEDVLTKDTLDNSYQCWVVVDNSEQIDSFSWSQTPNTIHLIVYKSGNADLHELKMQPFLIPFDVSNYPVFSLTVLKKINNEYKVSRRGQSGFSNAKPKKK
ncbi:MAG: hypothetical protein GC181_02880 [Bacteroidetes bacterium]|nr:hypothetical protein [Bacteroidota bacterium]